MEAPRVVRPTLSAKEYAERRYIHKTINAGVHYMQSKLGGFGFDAQTEQYGDVWRVTITVQWKPLPPVPVIVPSTDVDGLL